MPRSTEVAEKPRSASTSDDRWSGPAAEAAASATRAGKNGMGTMDPPREARARRSPEALYPTRAPPGPVSHDRGRGAPLPRPSIPDARGTRCGYTPRRRAVRRTIQMEAPHERHSPDAARVRAAGTGFGRAVQAGAFRSAIHSRRLPPGAGRGQGPQGPDLHRDFGARVTHLPLDEGVRVPGRLALAARRTVCLARHRR